MDGTQSYCADHFIRCAAAAKSLSHVRLLVTPWTAAYQAPPSMGFFQARALEWGAIAFSTSHPSIVQFPLFEHCIKVSSGQQCSL